MSEVAWNSEEQFGSWDSVPEEYVPPPPSVYRGVVVLAEKSPTKEGKPQIRVDIKNEFDMVDDEAAKGTLKYNNVLITQGEGGFRVKQLASSAEINLPASAKPDDVDAFCEELLGKTVYYRTRHDNYKGRVNVRVDRYFTAEQAQEAASQFEKRV